MGETKLTETEGFKDNYGRFMGMCGLHPRRGHININMIGLGVCACANNYVYGGMYSESWWTTGSLLLFFGIHSVFLASTLLLALDDLKLMGESAHFTVFRCLAIVAIINGWVRKPQLKILFTQLGGYTVHDYGNTLSKTCKTKIEQVGKDCASRKRFRAGGFAQLVTGALIIFWLRTLLEYYRGHLNHPRSEDGINRNLPVASYMPYESEEWPGYHIALITEIYLVLQSYCLVLGHDCVFICFSEEILRELEIVAITLKELKDRSEHLRREMGNKITRDDSVKICLRHSVQHHQKAIQLFNLFRDYAYWTLFGMLSGGAFLICLSALMFTSDKIKFEDKSVFMMFLGNELFHVFIFCFYGENIMLKSVEIGDSLYHSSWVEISKTVQPYFTMIKLRTHSPLTVTAGGFMTASFDTYSNVLRTAYSYLNLLQATSQ